jgi:hypothetical protein
VPVCLSYNQTFTEIKMQTVPDINADFSIAGALLIQECKESVQDWCSEQC